MAQIQRNLEITELENQFQTAGKLGKKECQKSGFCCHKRPCIPTPTELKKIAEFLKMSSVELINKFYAIDRNSGSKNYYLKPTGVNITDLAGKFIPGVRTFNEGKCVLLNEDNTCSIHSVRPLSARLMKCWEEWDDVKQKQSDGIYEEWSGNQLFKQFGISGEKLEVDGE